jgi:hypothetical protein
VDADHCRREGEHFTVCARQMTDLNDKVTFLELAAYWTHMAKEARNARPRKKKPARHNSITNAGSSRRS